VDRSSIPPPTAIKQNRCHYRSSDTVEHGQEREVGRYKPSKDRKPYLGMQGSDNSWTEKEYCTQSLLELVKQYWLHRVGGWDFLKIVLVSLLSLFTETWTVKNYYERRSRELPLRWWEQRRSGLLFPVAGNRLAPHRCNPAVNAGLNIHLIIRVCFDVLALLDVQYSACSTDVVPWCLAVGGEWGAQRCGSSVGGPRCGLATATTTNM
jgi:hypothetical protein